jgi:two-component system response regulator PilR (NtrC family)
MLKSDRILIVDDERSLCEFLEIFLSKEGYNVTTCPGGEEAVALAASTEEEFDLVLTDLMMPNVGGIEVLAAFKERFPDIQVLVMTAYATADTAISAMKKGAYDYVQKPFKVDEIKLLLEKALHQRRLLIENRALRAEVHRKYSFHNIIGRSLAMHDVFELIRRVADTRTSVLITGESGTGKELIARAIHHNSSRKDADLITVNCGAIPENLMESELFGHMKGAFTGAHINKEGMFQAANGGSLFLDEVGEMPMQLQVKLLRALQERAIRPVGATIELPVDVRIIAATNQNLEEAVKSGQFREDLYYRLNVIRVAMPPLRERHEDIPLIAQHFVARFSEEMGKSIQGFESQALEVLTSYDYPGNVRELENIVERAITFETSDMIRAESLPPQVLGTDPNEKAMKTLGTLPPGGLNLDELLGSIEKKLLEQALRRTGDNRTEAAKLLGISFRSIRYKLDKYQKESDNV